MNTRHSLTSLLVLASLALAAPALSQQERAPRRPAPPSDDLAKLTADMCRLGDELARLSDLADVVALSALRDVNGPSSLPRLAELRDLPHVYELRRLAPQHQSGQGRQSHRGGPEQTERVTRTFKVGRTGSLYLTNVSGDIVVKAGTGDEVAVDAIKRVRQGADAQQQLNLVTVDASQQGSRVEVRTRYPEGGGNFRASVDYTITVPSGTGVDLHTTSGDIQISGVKGAVHAECTSGDIRIEGADQVEQVKTVSGDITVTGSVGTDVRISNYSGDVTVRGLKARSLDLSTLSGEARLTDVTAERATIKTVSGDVDYAGPFARGGRYEFTAHSGDVRLTPTSGTGFEVDARTFSGDCRSDVPLTLRSGEVRPGREHRELKGTYGDGSAMVIVHTFNGDVTIVRK